VEKLSKDMKDLLLGTTFACLGTFLLARGGRAIKTKGAIVGGTFIGRSVVLGLLLLRRTVRTSTFVSTIGRELGGLGL
jgi:hypothetical protein